MLDFNFQTAALETSAQRASDWLIPPLLLRKVLSHHLEPLTSQQNDIGLTLRHYPGNVYR